MWEQTGESGSKMCEVMPSGHKKGKKKKTSQFIPLEWAKLQEQG